MASCQDAGNYATVATEYQASQQEPIVYTLPDTSPPPYDTIQQPYTYQNQLYYPYLQTEPSTWNAPATAGLQANSPNAVVVTQPVARRKQSFWGQYCFACIVFWCCGFVCGAIAFILAAIGNNKADDGNRRSARNYYKASLFINILGLVLGFVAWSILMWWLIGNAVACGWYLFGMCYKYRNCYLLPDQCSKYTSSYYYYGCCYFN